jgi:hypothetical protein
MAGGDPGQPCRAGGGSSTRLMRGNPDGSLSSRVGFAEALLSFRYIDGTLLRTSYS